MINEEVLGGIISGMERGESLKKSMLTLYNAGYKKEEIEEAAAMANQIGIKSQVIPLINLPEKLDPSISLTPQPIDGIHISQINPQTFLTAPKAKSISTKQTNPTPRVLSNTSSTKVVQKVSNYQSSDSKEKMMIFLLVSILVFLVGVLAAIFIFRQDLINFFSTIF